MFATPHVLYSDGKCSQNKAQNNLVAAELEGLVNQSLIPILAGGSKMARILEG